MHNHLGWTWPHVLQPLDVSCFKSFKTTCKIKRDNAMVINNHYELKQSTFVSSVVKVLDLILSKINIKNGFNVTWIWPFSPKAMDEETKQKEAYTITIYIHILNEK